MAAGGSFEELFTRGRVARATGDLRGAATLFQRARTVGVEQILSVLIQEAICATDAGLYDQAGTALDEFDRLTGPAPPPWAAAQAQLSRAAVLDAQARSKPESRTKEEL